MLEETLVEAFELVVTENFVMERMEVENSEAEKVEKLVKMKSEAQM